MSDTAECRFIDIYLGTYWCLTHECSAYTCIERHDETEIEKQIQGLMKHDGDWGP